MTTLKGKKIDSEFVTGFIDDCINNDRCSTEQIVSLAKSQISDIDLKIKEVDSLKLLRSKLLDVVLTFEPKQSDHNTKDYKILQLFNIKNKNASRFICNELKLGPIELDSLKDIMVHTFPDNEINFCIKQLIELKIVSKVGKHLLQGDMYKDYSVHVLRDLNE